MSYPSLTDGGSTDIALEHLERPLINNATGPRAHNAKYTALSTDEDVTSHQAPAASWFYRITLDTWIPEILALFISAASIAAIIGILKLYEGKKRPELSYGITLNAIVSILATTSRSMLIFAVSMCIGQLKWCWYHERRRKVEDIQTMDAASRGPLGSAILLFTLRARPLASLGAAITILALAFDPFIQQIVQYPSIPSVDPDKKSSLVRSSSFAIDPTSIDWQNAIGAGIWSGAERFAQQPFCPSGNCEWQKHWSTAWCSKCQDVTSYAEILDCQLDVGTVPTTELNHSGSCSVDLGHGDRFQVLGSFETHRYRDPHDDSGETFFYSNVSKIVRNGVWPLSPNLSTPLDNETYAGVTNPILALGNVDVQRCGGTGPGFEKELCVAFAEECVLSLCTREFETSVVNGTMDRTLIKDDFGCLSQVSLGSDLDPLALRSHCWQAGKPCADIVTSSVGFCSDSIVVETTKSSTDASSAPATVLVGRYLQRQLLTRLTGNQSARIGSDGSFDEMPTIASSDTIDYITANGLGPVLAGVAASLTQQALLANTSKIFEGTVLTTKTYVAVDWPWLIYPATLVFGSIVLLALTALHSHRCGLRIWKSSMLPLLYRTLDPDLLARQAVLHDVSAMTVIAGKAKVTLVETSREDGVVLTR